MCGPRSAAVRQAVCAGIEADPHGDVDDPPRRSHCGVPPASRCAPPPSAVGPVVSVVVGTGLAVASSAPGLGLTPATSALGLGSPLPHLRRDWAHRCPHLRRDWAVTLSAARQQARLALPWTRLRANPLRCSRGCLFVSSGLFVCFFGFICFFGCLLRVPAAAGLSACVFAVHTARRWSATRASCLESTRHASLRKWADEAGSSPVPAQMWLG